MARDSNTRQKVATANIQNTLVDVYYIGGSMFEFDFHDESTKPVRVPLDKLQPFIDAGKVKVTTPKQFAEICAKINADGTTSTENADGTPKSAMTKAMDMLERDNIVSVGADGKKEIVSAEQRAERSRKARGGERGAPDDARERKPKREPAPASAMAEDAGDRPRPARDGRLGEGNPDAQGQAAPAKSKRTERSRNYAKKKQQRGEGSQQGGQEAPRSPRESAPGIVRRESAPHEDGGEFSEYDTQLSEYVDERLSKPVEEGRKPPRRRRNDPNQDLNGDGVVDHFDTIEAERRSNAPGVVALIAATTLLSVIAFFGMFALGVSVNNARGHNGNENIQVTTLGDQNDSGSQQSTGGDAQGAEQKESPYTFVNRSDFDPETAVLNMPMADDAKTNVAVGLMRYIRECVVNGDVNGFGKIVAIDGIADQLSKSYADYAGMKQNLNNNDKDALQRNWRDRYILNEKQHIVDKDMLSSSYGGRVREVRQDPTNPYVLYVVMESVAGDHQRICYIITGDGNNSWALTGVTDAPGYISMICQGRSFF